MSMETICLRISAFFRRFAVRLCGSPVRSCLRSRSHSREVSLPMPCGSCSLGATLAYDCCTWLLSRGALGGAPDGPSRRSVPVCLLTSGGWAGCPIRSLGNCTPSTIWRRRRGSPQLPDGSYGDAPWSGVPRRGPPFSHFPHTSSLTSYSYYIL